MSSPSRASSSSSGRTIANADPVTRNALRYTVSAREYELLHEYLISRAPMLRKRAPQPTRKEKRKTEDAAPSREDEAIDYNAATIRLTLRLFLTAYSGLKLWDYVTEQLIRRKTRAVHTTRLKTKTPLLQSPSLRLSLSLSLILFLHRTLHRFFHRLRAALLHASSRGFRTRNPRTTDLLTSRLTPALGAATLSSTALAVAPPSQIRISIAIYTLSRALEYAYNALPPTGMLKRSQPSWFGSWLLMPLATGQLLHAFVFDRDCFPAAYGSFILSRSPEYIQHKPSIYPTTPQTAPWPSTDAVVDALARISTLRWPAFRSPILYPSATAAALLPPGLAAMAPITSPAHPGIPRLSCALLHPHDPSCGRTFLQYMLRAFPAMARFFAMVYGAFALFRWRAFVDHPVPFLNQLAARVLRTSLFLTGAIGTAWASICAAQRVLPGSVLSTQRWFLGGMLAGCWAWLERDGGRSNFMYSARTSVDSLWKVGRKRGWWVGVRDGDVVVFMVGMAVVGGVYESVPEGVEGGYVRKGLGVLRGDGWVDRAGKLGKGKGREKSEGKEE